VPPGLCTHPTPPRMHARAGVDSNPDSHPPCEIWDGSVILRASVSPFTPQDFFIWEYLSPPWNRAHFLTSAAPPFASPGAVCLF
jgi:hypothetical protein